MKTTPITADKRESISVRVTVDFGGGQTYAWVAHAMVHADTVPIVTATASDGRPMGIYRSDVE